MIGISLPDCASGSLATKLKRAAASGPFRRPLGISSTLHGCKIAVLLVVISCAGVNSWVDLYNFSESPSLSQAHLRLAVLQVAAGTRSQRRGWHIIQVHRPPRQCRLSHRPEYFSVLVQRSPSPLLGTPHPAVTGWPTTRASTAHRFRRSYVTAAILANVGQWQARGPFWPSAGDY
jgi:hypothetical protein